MLDCGSNRDIISRSMIHRMNLTTQKAEEPLVVRLADGTKKKMAQTCTITYTIDTFTDTRTFYVLDLSGFDIIWGMDFLHDVDASVKFGYRQINLTSNGKHRKDLIGPDGLSRRPDYFEDLAVLHTACFSDSLDDWLAQMEFIESLPTPSHIQSETAEESFYQQPNGPETSSAFRYDDYQTVGDLTIMCKWFAELRDSYKSDPIHIQLANGIKVPHYELKSTLIYYSNEKHSAHPRLYIPDIQSLRDKIIAEMHDVPFQGHFSTTKTVDRIQRYFYWSNITDSVVKYIKSCDKCNRHKFITVHPKTSNTPYDVPNWPWEVMCMDEKTGRPSITQSKDSTMQI